MDSSSIVLWKHTSAKHVNPSFTGPAEAEKIGIFYDQVETRHRLYTSNRSLASQPEFYNIDADPATDPKSLKTWQPGQRLIVGSAPDPDPAVWYTYAAAEFEPGQLAKAKLGHSKRPLIVMVVSSETPAEPGEFWGVVLVNEREPDPDFPLYRGDINDTWKKEGFDLINWEEALPFLTNSKFPSSL